MAWQWWCFAPLLLSASCWGRVRIEQDSDMVTAGGSTRLTCRFPAKPASVRWTSNATSINSSVIWLYRNSPSQDKKSDGVDWNIKGGISEDKTSHTIFLHNVFLDMEGSYKCELEYDDFSTPSAGPVQLTVNVPPKFYIQFEDEDKLTEGEDAKVKCIASGYKPDNSLSFSLTNHSNSQRITTMDPGTPTDNGNKTFTQEAIGVVKLSWLDRRTTSLTCEAQWMGQRYPSKQLHVTNMKFGPKLEEQQLKAFYESSSRPLIFSFSLYGDPAPTVNCTSLTNKREETSDEARYMYEVTITSPKKESISCTAQNGIGSGNSFNIQVQENTKPDQPMNLKVANITQDSATVTWTSNHNGGPEQTFSIDLKSSGGWSKTGDSITDRGYGEVHSKTLTGLDSGSVYLVRIQATNSIGSAFSVDGKFETEVSGSSNAGVIAGVVVGGVVIVIIIVVVAVCLKRKRAAGPGTKKVQLFEMADQNRNNQLAAGNGRQRDVTARRAPASQPPALPPALPQQAVSSSQPQYEPPEYAVPGKKPTNHSAQRNGNPDVVYTDVVTQRLSPGQKRAIKKAQPTEYSTVCFNQEVLHVSDSDSD